MIAAEFLGKELPHNKNTTFGGFQNNFVEKKTFCLFPVTRWGKE